ncbi:sensor histidine kinase [Lacibacter sp.]|uniref:sensor histidine kinase n=1 Tax=Lacibacter sp. TaxID=1915409 RepID=UPI002B4B8D5C|nr:ATP-binding protein [Lacibacter sp.]HLP39560.1 ATP-binding protein [Lacibacter sp.]
MDTTETRIYTAFLIGSIVIGALFLYFAVSMIRKHRRHFDLLRRYYLQESRILENDRSRIARDLHDDLGPLVSVAHLLIRNCRGANEEEREYLAKAEESMQELTRRFRDTANGLASAVLNDKGLQPAIEQFLSKCRTACDIQFLLTYKLKQEPDKELGLHIYRLVQELLHNAIKHSKAMTVELRILERKGIIHLFYTDDGIGLAKNKHADGTGIKNMRSRASVLNGVMEVGCGKNKGTEIYFALPINQRYE